MKVFLSTIFTIMVLLSCQGSDAVEQNSSNSLALGGWWSEAAGVVYINEDVLLMNLPLVACSVESISETQLVLVDCAGIGEGQDSVTYNISQNEDGSISLIDESNSDNNILLEDISAAAENF